MKYIIKFSNKEMRISNSIEKYINNLEIFSPKIACDFSLCLHKKNALKFSLCQCLSIIYRLMQDSNYLSDKEKYEIEIFE